MQTAAVTRASELVRTTALKFLLETGMRRDLLGARYSLVYVIREAVT
jgi:hypothetical protein